MKKMIALVMVLSIASLASAALTEVLSFVDGVGVTWTLDLAQGKVFGTGTALGTYEGAYLKKTSGVGSIAPTALVDLGAGGYKDGTYEAAGDLAGVADAEPWWLATADESNDPAFAQALGLWFEFDVTPATNGDIVVDIFADAALTEGALQGTVPEPATMVLLGLGALVLRRKK